MRQCACDSATVRVHEHPCPSNTRAGWGARQKNYAGLWIKPCEGDDGNSSRYACRAGLCLGACNGMRAAQGQDLTDSWSMRNSTT